jgi:hypothetical protein
MERTRARRGDAVSASIRLSVRIGTPVFSLNSLTDHLSANRPRRIWLPVTIDNLTVCPYSAIYGTYWKYWHRMALRISNASRAPTRLPPCAATAPMSRHSRRGVKPAVCRPSQRPSIPSAASSRTRDEKRRRRRCDGASTRSESSQAAAPA